MTLKEIQTRKAELSDRIAAVKADIANLEMSKAALSRQLAVVVEQETKMKQDGLQVSEHAVLRYLERHMNVDVEHVKKIILSGESGARVVIKGNVVVTVK